MTYSMSQKIAVNQLTYLFRYRREVLDWTTSIYRGAVNQVVGAML